MGDILPLRRRKCLEMTAIRLDYTCALYEVFAHVYPKFFCREIEKDQNMSEGSEFHPESDRTEPEHVYATEPEHMYATSIELSVASLMADSLEIGAEEQFGTAPSPPEAVIIEESQPGTSSRHHVGPIGEAYIRDKRARQKSFSKRLKTFQKSAQLLNTMCGAKVKFTITSESGRQVCGSFPSLKMRHVGLQAGQPAEAPFTRQSATQGTPKKTPAKLAKQIANMPGKKEKKMSFTQKAVNKCAVCGIIFNSAKDKLFKKKHRLQGEWLGCEKDGCEFWGHAICAKVKISSRKNIPSIQLHGTHP